MERKLLERLKKDFSKLAKDPEVLAILLYGSHARGEASSRSDIDICIVAPKTKDQVELLRKAWREVGGKYDLWLFEELPLYIQAEIIDTHKVVYCKDLPELFEYFYPYRKRIAEFRYRQKMALGDGLDS
ncbi:hypothetical protein DRO91_02125 [Candidatus Heimdallarchaeota archaeon]|nr:MAG: hypothetical protein DRP02_09635 [Candidatus Gerdarchaeota archaeon]RLI73795.1 MAG: hypothetical protein DRO91_02125 [Candidatus Heimdallarchaeota archaeon]